MATKLKNIENLKESSCPKPRGIQRIQRLYAAYISTVGLEGISDGYILREKKVISKTVLFAISTHRERLFNCS